MNLGGLTPLPLCTASGQFVSRHATENQTAAHVPASWALSPQTSKRLGDLGGDREPGPLLGSLEGARGILKDPLHTVKNGRRLFQPPKGGEKRVREIVNRDFLFYFWHLPRR